MNRIGTLKEKPCLFPQFLHVCEGDVKLHFKFVEAELCNFEFFSLSWWVPTLPRWIVKYSQTRGQEKKRRIRKKVKTWRKRERREVQERIRQQGIIHRMPPLPILTSWSTPVRRRRGRSTSGWWWTSWGTSSRTRTPHWSIQTFSGCSGEFP